MFSLDLFIIIITNTCFYIILSKVNSCEGLVFLTKVTFLYVFVVTLLEKIKIKLSQNIFQSLLYYYLPVDHNVFQTVSHFVPLHH